MVKAVHRRLSGILEAKRELVRNGHHLTVEDFSNCAESFSGHLASFDR